MRISRCSREIRNHKSIRSSFSGLSNSIQNDLISCIAGFLINQIKIELSNVCFFLFKLMIGSTDISQNTQCSIIIRYVTDKFELIERFLGFHNVNDDRTGTAQGLFNLIYSVLFEFDLKNKLV